MEERMNLNKRFITINIKKNSKKSESCFFFLKKKKIYFCWKKKNFEQGKALDSIKGKSNGYKISELTPTKGHNYQQHNKQLEKKLLHIFFAWKKKS